jgi:cysteine synthase B
MPNQYENQQNARAHFRTTGPEIWRQTEGKVTHLFVSLGTCGTVSGTSRFLKEKNPAIRVIAVQPSQGHDIPGLRNVSELEVSALYDPSLIDEIVEIPFELAYARVLDLCRQEGLLAGPSSGLILEGALRVQKQGAAGLGVMIFPDGLFKYVEHIAKHIEGIAEMAQV